MSKALSHDTYPPSVVHVDIVDDIAGSSQYGQSQGWGSPALSVAFYRILEAAKQGATACPDLKSWSLSASELPPGRHALREVINAVEDAFMVDFPNKKVTYLAKQLDLRAKKRNVNELVRTLNDMAQMPVLSSQRHGAGFWWSALGVKGAVDRKAIYDSSDMATSFEELDRSSKRRLRSFD